MVLGLIGVGSDWVEISYLLLQCVCQVISFAMYAFRRLTGSPDRFLNPWENSCRGCWSCRGTVWICAPGSGPRRSCLSRRQLVVSRLFAIFDSEALQRELMPRNRPANFHNPTRIPLIFWHPR